MRRSRNNPARLTRKREIGMSVVLYGMVQEDPMIIIRSREQEQE